MSITNINQFIAGREQAVPRIEQRQWTSLGKTTFRIFFVYFFIQVVPLDWKFYSDLFSVNWRHLDYSDIFNIAHYTPRLFATSQTYSDWAVLFFIAIIIGLVWTYAVRNKNTSYASLYYWLRVIVRYRLAVGIIAYGAIKFFPLQSPYPSLANLNTSYGDFTRWKLFSLSLGIVPNYESFLGAVEIVTGLLLLYRKTASIGAFIVVVFTGNVFMSNLAYDGGEQVYSLFLITLAIFILTFDIQRLFNLLVLQKPTPPNTFKPVLAPWQQWTRYGLKTAVVFFFVVLYGFKVQAAARNGQAGVNKNSLPGNSSGLYNVAVFTINKDTIAYSKTDSLRWQDVVIERWNTISIRSNRPVVVDSSNTGVVGSDYVDKAYELQGSAGRHYYSYEADTTNHKLTLHNKNKHYAGETMTFLYKKINDSTISLSGLNERKDSIYVLLNRLDKKYLLQVVEKAGRQKPLKL